MDGRSRIRVMVVDDHDLIRAGLRLLFNSCEDLELVAETSSGRHAIDLCVQDHPDVVLIDLMISDYDGVALIRTLHDTQPDVRIVALTSYDDQEMVYSALEAGALSYLLKSISFEELASAIRKAACGKTTLAQEAIQALVQVHQRPQVPDYGLTHREEEVLEFLIQGLSNREIAQRAFVSYSTVKKHVSSIICKLSVSSRTEAVALAIQQKLVQHRISSQ